MDSQFKKAIRKPQQQLQSMYNRRKCLYWLFCLLFILIFPMLFYFLPFEWRLMGSCLERQYVSNSLLSTSNQFPTCSVHLGIIIDDLLDETELLKQTSTNETNQSWFLFKRQLAHLDSYLRFQKHLCVHLVIENNEKKNRLSKTMMKLKQPHQPKTQIEHLINTIHRMSPFILYFSNLENIEFPSKNERYDWLVRNFLCFVSGKCKGLFMVSSTLTKSQQHQNEFFESNWNHWNGNSEFVVLMRSDLMLNLERLNQLLNPLLRTDHSIETVFIQKYLSNFFDYDAKLPPKTKFLEEQHSFSMMVPTFDTSKSQFRTDAFIVSGASLSNFTESKLFENSNSLESQIQRLVGGQQNVYTLRRDVVFGEDTSDIFLPQPKEHPAW